MEFVNAQYFASTLARHPDGLPLIYYGAGDLQDKVDYLEDLRGRITSEASAVEYAIDLDGYLRPCPGLLSYHGGFEGSLQDAMETFALHWSAYLVRDADKTPGPVVFADYGVPYVRAPRFPAEDPTFLVIGNFQALHYYIDEAFDRQGQREVATAML